MTMRSHIGEASNLFARPVHLFFAHAAASLQAGMEQSASIAEAACRGMCFHGPFMVSAVFCLGFRKNCAGDAGRSSQGQSTFSSPTQLLSSRPAWGKALLRQKKRDAGRSLQGQSTFSSPTQLLSSRPAWGKALLRQKKRAEACVSTGLRCLHPECLSVDNFHVLV